MGSEFVETGDTQGVRTEKREGNGHDTSLSTLRPPVQLTDAARETTPLHESMERTPSVSDDGTTSATL